MNSETLEEREQELRDMKEQLTQVAEVEKEKAAPIVAPPPEPDPSPAPEASSPTTPPVQEVETPPPSEAAKPKDDPMEWAKAKGFKTPEDMARALLQKEREFHDSRQKQQPSQPSPAVPPAWQPQPDMGNGYAPPYYPQPGYYPPPPPPPRRDYRDLAALYPNVDPEDLNKLMPVVLDAAQVVARQERQILERQINGIQRSTERNNEIMTLMQDPAFRDTRVQREIHSVLDADPSILQRERAPFVEAFKQAMFNLGRKQLQLGVTTEASIVNMPPVTAGGGNGSAHTSPRKITERDFDSWSIKDQKAYLESNGRILPKK